MIKRYFWLKHSPGANAGNSAVELDKVQRSGESVSEACAETIHATVHSMTRPDQAFMGATIRPGPDSTITGATIRTGPDSTITGATIRTGPDSTITGATIRPGPDSTIMGATIRFFVKVDQVSFHVLDTPGVTPGEFSFYVENGQAAALAFESPAKAEEFARSPEFKAWLGGGRAVLTALLG